MPTDDSCACSRSTCRLPPGTRPVNGNVPTGAALANNIGAPNSICITPGPNQVMFVGESTFPGRVFKVTLDGQGARRHRQIGPPAQAVLGRPPTRVSVRTRGVCGRDVELAGAEVDPASMRRLAEIRSQTLHDVCLDSLARHRMAPKREVQRGLHARPEDDSESLQRDQSSCRPSMLRLETPQQSERRDCSSRLQVPRRRRRNVLPLITDGDLLGHCRDRRR